MKGAAPKAQLHPSPSLGCTGLLIKSPCGSDGSASTSLMCHQRSPEWDPWMELTTAMELAHHGNICFVGTAPSCQEGTTD